MEGRGACDVELGAFYFFGSKIIWRELSSGPPTVLKFRLYRFRREAAAYVRPGHRILAALR